jgi:hypothetical protein
MPLNTALESSASIPAMSWEAFDIKGLDLVKVWSLAVSRALRGDHIDSETVQLAGRACVVESQLLSGAPLGRAVADAAGFPYVSLDPHDAEFAAVTECIDQPTVVHLEAGAWQTDCGKVASQWKGPLPASLHEQLQQIKSTQALLLQILQSRPVVYVTLTKEISAFSLPLQQVGAFDRQIALGGPVQEVMGALWLTKLGDLASPSLLKSRLKVAGLMSKHDINPDAVILRLRRLAVEENRSIELADLIDIVYRGTSQTKMVGPDTEDSRAELHRIAVHEAGHALMTVIDSGGQRIPDYASAFGSNDFGGFVLSLEEHKNPVTYTELRYRVRVALAGRAAEEVAYGSANVTNGAGSDLLSATQHCTWAFSVGGLAPGMDDKTKSGTNLAVVLNDDPAAMAEVRGLVQHFLATEYQYVLAALTENRGLLDALAQRLVLDRIVDQAEMRETLRELIRTNP